MAARTALLKVRYGGLTRNEKYGGHLLFSDIHNDRRMRFTVDSGLDEDGHKYLGSLTVEAQPVNRHNGLTRDLQGRLIAAEHDGRRISRLEHDGSTTVLANQFQGRQLNRPNDVVVKSDGSIYFTDPWTFRRPGSSGSRPFPGVFRVSADLGTLTLLVSDFVVPNGLAFSPDESILYINDSRKGIIRAFDVQDDGTLPWDPTGCLLICVLTPERGVLDGMKVDTEGNIYCGGSGGIHILNPGGERLGIVCSRTPPPLISVLATTTGSQCFSPHVTASAHLESKYPASPVPAK